MIIRAGDSIEGIFMGKPQMPRPYYCAILHHGDNGIAILNVRCGYFELHEGIIVGIVHNLGCTKLHKPGFIRPNHLGIVHTIVGPSIGPLNPWVGDVLIVMIFEMLQHISDVGVAQIAFIGIGLRIWCPILDGVAIHQRYLIKSRMGDDITVGGVTRCNVAFDIMG